MMATVYAVAFYPGLHLSFGLGVKHAFMSTSWDQFNISL